MEKDQKILIGLISLTIIVAVIIGIYFLIIKKDESTDAIKFKNEYESYNNKIYENNHEKYLEVSIDDKNLFVYKTDKEIVDILKKQTGIIYFGFANCPYCRSMVSILNDIAKEKNIDKIYYVDIENIRDTYEVVSKIAVKITNGTENYYKILNLLDEYLGMYTITDTDAVEYNTGVKRLYAPTVVTVDNGEIVGFHEGTIEEASYNVQLSDDEKKDLVAIYSDMITNLLEKNICTKKNC